MKRSLMAEKTAREVLATIGRGERPVIKEIAMRNGYAETTAGAGIVQNMVSYKAIVNPVLEKMERLRHKALDAAMHKDLSKESYVPLVNSAATLTHDIQLLSGGRTENVGVEEDRRVLIGIVEKLRSINGVDKPRIE